MNEMDFESITILIRKQLRTGRLSIEMDTNFRAPQSLPVTTLHADSKCGLLIKN